MSQLTIEEFYAPECRFEEAANSILRAAGLKVLADYLAPAATGEADENIKAVPDDVCDSIFELGQVSDDIRVFRDDASLDGGLASEPAGFEGVLTITHRIPVSDAGAGPGEIVKCYKRLCLQRGKIRVLLRSTAKPFKDLLPEYDVTDIAIIQPERHVAGERSANEAKERFRIRYIPTEGMYPSG